MANATPCGQCTFYDPMHRGLLERGFGWCSKLSQYPDRDSPGQTTPPHAQRVAAGEPAKPVLVKKAEIRPACPHVSVSKKPAFTRSKK